MTEIFDHSLENAPASVSAGGGGDSRLVGGLVPAVPDKNPPILTKKRSVPPPQLLTGGIPSSFFPKTPSLPLEEVAEFSHGGYDGGIEVGFVATWNDSNFSTVMAKLESAKERACEIQKGPEGFKIEIAGEEVLVMPTGGKVGGLLYKYRFLCRGVEFLIHSNPPEGRQPVRVRYLAESLTGNNFFVVHEQFTMKFLKRLGLTVHADKPSRIDMQVMIDVSASEFIRLFESGHVVTKLRKGSIHFVNGNVVKKETLTLGSSSKVQVCIYDKRKELSKNNLHKQVSIVKYCIGDEWFNSERPITRIEIRLGRVALKCLGVNTVSDLKEREHAIVDLVTHDWFRILEKPKVRGCENRAAMHPVWERVRALFSSCFSGSDVSGVKWEKNQNVVCDPVALEAQALGCLSKALACRFGEQSVQSSVDSGISWIMREQKKLNEKVNTTAEHIRLKTGIVLGESIEEFRETISEGMLDSKKREVNAWLMQSGGVQTFCDVPSVHEFMDFHRKLVASEKEHHPLE